MPAGYVPAAQTFPRHLEDGRARLSVLEQELVRTAKSLRPAVFLGLLVALIVGGCECGDDRAGGRNQGTTDSGAMRRDSGDLGSDAASDGGPGLDVGPPDSGFDMDAGQPDSGFEIDAGMPDMGFMIDAGQPADAGVPPDTGIPPDTGVPPDTGIPPDTGVIDSGTPPDSGVTPGSGDLWIEIRYAGANSVRSPRWSYSTSPGWTASDWGFQGNSGAEVWDLRNNGRVINDHVGDAAIMSGELQLMLGLTSLISSTGVTVELEGRSYNCCAPVRFDLFNPATGCGVSGLTMSQSWNPSMVTADLTGCFVPGSNLQAVRLDPVSGTIALTRMRLTFHGARW